VICPKCKYGAALYQLGLEKEAEGAHGECPGPEWCDCQHRVPRDSRM
jgi:hypothetical protein